MLEIERKYLIQEAVPSVVRNYIPIRQGYICATVGREARLRDEGGRYWLTLRRYRRHPE